MLKTLLTIGITIAATLVFLFGFRILFATPSYHQWEHVVLTKDVTLKYGDEVVGTLLAGTTVHAPCSHDTAYTDPWDPKTFKVYVEFGYPTRIADCTMPLSQLYDDGGHTRNVLNLHLAGKSKGEQGEALKP